MSEERPVLDYARPDCEQSSIAANVMIFVGGMVFFPILAVLVMFVGRLLIGLIFSRA